MKKHLVNHCKIIVRQHTTYVNCLGDGHPSMSHREMMPFTCAFIEEILRHRTITSLAIQHMVTEDVEVQGFRFPKGTIVRRVIFFLI